MIIRHFNEITSDDVYNVWQSRRCPLVRKFDVRILPPALEIRKRGLSCLLLPPAAKEFLKNVSNLSKNWQLRTIFVFKNSNLYYKLRIASAFSSSRFSWLDIILLVRFSKTLLVLPNKMSKKIFKEMCLLICQMLICCSSYLCLFQKIQICLFTDRMIMKPTTLIKWLCNEWQSKLYNRNKSDDKRSVNADGKSSGKYFWFQLRSQKLLYMQLSIFILCNTCYTC